MEDDTIRLPHRPAARRGLALTGASVAALSLLLTAAPVHAQKLVGKGKIFLRFTNLRADDAKILIRLNVVPNHIKPFGWGGMTILVGSEVADAQMPAEKWLSPAQRSPWADVGQFMNLRGTRSPDTYLSPILCGVMTAQGKPGLHLLAEVAEGRGQRIIRRIAVNKPDLRAGKKDEYPWILGYSVWNKSRPLLPTLGLLVPSRPEIASRIYTLEEALNWQLDVIKGFPVIGRTPTTFVFKTWWGQPGWAQPEISKALGYNRHPEDTVEASFGDEITIQLKTPIEEQNRRFREHLKKKGFDPLQLIGEGEVAKARTLAKQEQWKLVTITPALADKPKHFYESANFRYQLWYEELAARTKKAKAQHPGKRVLSGANFSPHMNVWPDVRQWVGPFRAGAMTMTWTEDWWWQVPEASPQVHGFLLDGFRLAHSYHGAPAQYYVMPFRGNSPDNFRRMHALAFAHGVKILNHFVTATQVLVTHDYISVMDSPRTYQAIHDVTNDAGAVEHRLHPAMPQQARIAIMLSRASDTWDTEDLGGAGHLYFGKFNVNNDERKAIWMALRHAQYPVDLILDEDFAEGRLKPYKVLYIVGSEMLRAAAEPLMQWVKDGGIVYATGGGGLLDEYRSPLTMLHDMYGLKSHKLVRHTRHIRPRNTMRSVEPVDTLTVKPFDETASPVTLPAYLYRETLEPKNGADVAGTYGGDQTDGLVTNRFGKGRSIYCGALAGMAYLTPAMTTSSQILPTAFPKTLRDFIATPVRWAGIATPIETSEPLVEAQYMTGPEGDVVVLINWQDKPIDDLVVRFPNKREIQSVRSLREAGPFKGHLHEQKGGTLPIRRDRGGAEVRLRLGISDYLLVD